VCRLTVRDQAKQLHGSGPPRETSIHSLEPDPRLPNPQDYSSKYQGTRYRVVECAGLGYGTRLSGYTAPDLSMERAPVLQSRPPGYRTLPLSQRGPKLQAWLLNSDVIMSAGMGTV
jgi:hypothetical protein